MSVYKQNACENLYFGSSILLTCINNKVGKKWFMSQKKRFIVEKITSEKHLYSHNFSFYTGKLAPFNNKKLQKNQLFF